MPEFGRPRRVVMIGEGETVEIRRACHALVDVEFELRQGWDSQSVGALVGGEPDLAIFDLRDQQGPMAVRIASRVRELTGSAIVFVVGGRDADMLADMLEDARAEHPAAFLIEPLTSFQCELVLDTALYWTRELRSLRGRVQSQSESLGRLAARVDLEASIRPGLTGNPETQDESLGAGDQPFRQCTRREQEVLSLFVRGHRVSTIADRLRISPGTVRSHLKSIFRKTNVRSQAELMETIGTSVSPDPASDR